MEKTKPFRKDAIRNGIPPLVTKNSSDLLPLNIRAGLTKDSQPAAILHQRQVNRLEIPVKVRRKSAHEMRSEAQENDTEMEHTRKQKSKVKPPTSGIYIPCQINGMGAFGQVNTSCEHSALSTETAATYGRQENNVPTFCTYLQFCSIRCRETLRLKADVPFGIVQIGLDILRKYRCLLDFSSSTLKIEGATSDPLPFLTAEDVFTESKLTRSKSSTL
ncbi:hypothetical protein HOLleu_36780 [Holothuria leucospilota]|uniref:Uncharacterized protein n=1 Tax=Holothuria leucospilota TaxID=206669 RepID=A0A9Q1BFX0_HOLLE|nr:hypothetical protein HOLleu_36780 [Holothuria leucospilota]